MDAELTFEKRYRLLREIIETIVLTILMFLVIHSAVQNFNVDGHSMEPSLHNNELILVDKWTYLFHAPARGDVVVFVAPPNPTQDYVKRIIGEPGDVITINNGVPTVNGVTLQEYYVQPTNMGATPGDNPIFKEIVPPNDYFVMGDNRAGSSDSRTWGFLPRKNIIGRAALVYWPLGQDNSGLLPNVSSVYAKVQAQTAANGHGLDVDEMLLVAMPGVFVVFSLYSKRRRKSINDRNSMQ
jgi:signal peptidase I